MDGTLRFLDILEVLGRHRVEFVIVGGVAAVLEGAPVATFDLDVVYARDADNIVRLATALRELDAVYKDPAGRRLLPDEAKLAAMTVKRPVADVVALAPDILAGKVRGRIVLELG